MVKNVLIGKNAGGEADDAAADAWFVGSRFILNESRGVMVNRSFRNGSQTGGNPRHSLRMNPILSRAGVGVAGEWDAMPVQRKVFRIEEGARSRAAEGVDSGEAHGTPRYREFMAELQTLRELIGPRAEVDRDALERARMQIAEVQAYKHELGLIYAAVERTRNEMTALGADAPGSEQTARARRELAAIVGGTERATQSILQAAEEIDQAANTLSASIKHGHDQGLAQDIQDRVLQIFEACNFQDLTGQRVAHVVTTLQFVEEHVARLLAIWHAVEQFTPVVFGEETHGDRRFLNGPKLPEDRGHSSQDDIDGIFGCA